MPLRWLKSRAPQMSADEAHRALGGQRALPAQHVAQGLALDVLHDDVGGRAQGGAVLAGVVDRDDGRVVQRGRGLRLAPEADLEGRVAGQVAAQHLDGDLAAEPQVATAVHLGHAAAAEDPADLVALTEHLRRGHRRSSRAVRCVIRARAAESSRAAVPTGPRPMHGPVAGAAPMPSLTSTRPRFPAPTGTAPSPGPTRTSALSGGVARRQPGPVVGSRRPCVRLTGAEGASTPWCVGRLGRRGRASDVVGAARSVVVSALLLRRLGRLGVSVSSPASARPRGRRRS